MGILISNKGYLKEYDAFFARYKDSMDYLASFLDEDYQRPDTLKKLPWRSFAFYNKCIKNLQGDDKDLGLEFFKKAGRSENGAAKSITFSGLSEDDPQDEIDLIFDEVREETSGKISIGFISPDFFDAEKAKLLEGINLLRLHSTDLYEEAEFLIDEITLIGPGNEYHVRSASSYNLFGLVLIWADEVHSPIYYALLVIHEAAHLRLFLMSADDQFVLNPEDQLYAAPFRPDPRPMLGIFHAFFVLARMALAMYDLEKMTSGKLAEEAHEKRTMSEKRFFATAVQVKLDGDLTPAGQLIFDECLQEITKISSFRNIYDDEIEAALHQV